MNWRTLDDMDLAGKRVLIRVDINVPMENGRVTDATRIQKIVPAKSYMLSDLDGQLARTVGFLV